MKYHKVIAFVAWAALSAGCSPMVDNRGHVQDPDWQTRVIAGKTTQDEVLATMGSPSSRSSFGNETWYYIAARREAHAFLKPEIAEQSVTRVEFDSSGVVSAIKTYSKEDGKAFDTVSRTTPTEGHTLSFFEQVLGNIGRFNNSKGNTVAPGRRPGR